MKNISIKAANDLFRAKKYNEAMGVYQILVSQGGVVGEIAKQNINLIKLKAKSNTTLDVKVKNREVCRPSQSFEGGRDVFVGIASIPQRVAFLEKTIESLKDQVSRVGIFLDGYEEVPSFLLNDSKIEFKQSKDFDRPVGDAGKFYWVDSFEGYYFTCDDDLIYPPDFVFRTIRKIEAIRPSVVGWHGSVFMSPFEDYYTNTSRRVFTFSAPRPKALSVHLLGTGCLGFHTSDISVKFSDFLTPNMADVYFAKLAQEQEVPLIVIEHNKDEILEQEQSQEYSIYKHSSEDQLLSKHNTRVTQNEVVKSINWKINLPKRFLKILVIGRFEINPKGGVYKSSFLLRDNLSGLGHDVDTLCLSKLSSLDLSANYDVAIVYAPDPDRPDFGDTLGALDRLAKAGVVCVVNFSFNLVKERTTWIEHTLLRVNKGFDKPRIFFGAFTNSTALLFSEEVSDMVVRFPKTISIGESRPVGFYEREGIFLGDLAKLSNEKLVFGRVEKWLEQLRINLPHVNIYSLKHYHTDKLPANYIKVLPYQDGLENVLNQFRLAVCLTPGATFEMIPVEAALCGTPVIHRFMPHSLSEYLSPASIQVSSPEELGLVAKNIYDNPVLWSKLSNASAGARELLTVDNLIASIDVAIRQCMNRAGFGV